MKKSLWSFLVSLIFVSISNASQKEPLKPRVIILTDVSTWETDDSQSLVRLFAYADMFEIEGLIYTTGWSLDTTRKDFFALIHTAIDAYERDLPNLCKRSGQTGFSQDGHWQRIGYWPSADYLRSRTVFGSKYRGARYIGSRNDSDGSKLIIDQANEKDDRPVWVLGWGGANTLAQAVWQIQNNKNDLKDFLDKIRFYAITDQDRDQNTPYENSSHQWLRRDFADDLFFIWDESAWSYQNRTGKNKWPEYEDHSQKHGKVGKVYPKYKYGVEGDTPSFLYLLPNGLNAPEKPGLGGWGGYFAMNVTPDGVTRAYTNHNKIPAKKVSAKYERYFYPAIFNDFAARMNWAKEGRGNRNPVVKIKQQKNCNPVVLNPRQGKSIHIDATKSIDPDNDELSYHWWVLSEAGSYKGDISLLNPQSKIVTVNIPPDSAGTDFHLICEVIDNGTPSLTSYRRVIIKPKRK